MLVDFEELRHQLHRALLGLGFAEQRAAVCADLFARTDLDGVTTHGLARFPRFVATVRSGVVNARAQAGVVSATGATEVWDGHGGAGNLNAWAAMERACELAGEHGIGGVALRNTNHWMRGGSYGWQAADAGFAGMCWTNTLANLPAWGGSKAVLGNNPLVMAVPREGGAHVVLDMAMSQYSYGGLAGYAARGEALPYAGGFDAEGNLTTDAAAIMQSERALPIGLWKGSGLSLMLDLFAASLSGGRGVKDVPRDPLRETGLSQMFMAVRPGDAHTVEGIVASLTGQGRYPGENTLAVRNENLARGVPVDEAIWTKLLGGEI